MKVKGRYLKTFEMTRVGVRSDRVGTVCVIITSYWAESKYDKVS